ncbi:MAG: sortase [Scrofimicrobium sp.]
MAEKSTGPLWESTNGWQLHRLPFGAAVVSLVIAALLIAPSIANWSAANARAHVLAGYAEAVANTSDVEQKTLLNQAHICNAAMTSQAYVLPSFALPQGSIDGLEDQAAGSGSRREVPAQWTDASSECGEAFAAEWAPGWQGDVSYSTLYNAALNLGDGVLARLTIPSIGLDAPVYHRVDGEGGVGHVPSTSLPVGGEGTNPVLVGRDGGIFTDLGRLQVGDRLTLQVMSETLAYQVTSSEVVEVDQTASIEAEAGEDLVTLVTAPAANILAQHRLVTAERVEVTDAELATLAGPVRGGGFPWWLVTALVVLGLLAVVVWWSGRPLEDEEAQDSATTNGSDNESGGFGDSGAELEEDSGVRSVSSFAGDSAFQEYLANYQMDPRTEAELWDDEGEDSSYRNVQQKE